MVSETPTDGRCNYEYSTSDDYDPDSGYCESRTMDSGRCFHHGGQNYNGSAPEGNNNSETHGAFKEHFRSDLTDDEKAAIDGLVSHLEDIDGVRAVPAEVAAEALMKYKRSADSRFLREARQWFSEFNLLPNEDSFELSGGGGGPLEVSLNETVVESPHESDPEE